MKKLLASALAFLITGSVCAVHAASFEVSGLSLDGEIQGENIVFTLSFTVDIKEKGAVVPLVTGDVAYLDGKLPGKSKLIRDGDKYALEFEAPGLFSSNKHDVTFRFASRALKDGDWRKTLFAIPGANIRNLSVLCDRNDLKIEFPDALAVKRQMVKKEKDKNEQLLVTAFLGISGEFQVRWKPEVKRLDSELVVSCDANTIATASVGALRIDSVLTYRVIQGSLEELTIDLPDVNVTQVSGEDIQNWRIDKSDAKNPKLLVTLGRPQESVYRLRVESEMILPKFPTAFDLPVLVPESVIRTSGFLLIGTDSAIKMQVSKAGGLTQVDQASFPAVTMDKTARAMPSRSTYAYQYANTPYTLALKADDIVTAFSADDRIVLTLADNELVMNASVELDIKDAPAREIRIETDADAEWTVTSISGRFVSEADTDVREENGKRVIYVPFKSAVQGVTLINVRMEKTLKRDVKDLEVPSFIVVDARSERGYLVAASEKGIRVNARKGWQGLQEIHTGSAPMRVPNAQQAFRFKKAGWKVQFDIQRTISAIYSEVFHLVSLGQGVMYGSASITYHIDGAPVQEFRINVPKDIETVEFTGLDIEGWQRSGEVCTVKLHNKVIGDYNLLVTYDKQFDYRGANIPIGGIETVQTESEMGYVAVVSSLSLHLKLGDAKGLTPVERDEIPSEYAAPLTDPIIASYKYVNKPHSGVLNVVPYETDSLLGQVADYVELKTIISRDGESKTWATYFIKNTTEQYLVAELPDGIDTVHSVVLVDEDGAKHRVSTQINEKKQLLIPVRRPRNPNTPIKLELAYANSHGELGFWRSGVKGIELAAPILPETHAAVTRWTIKAETHPDDRYVIEGANRGRVMTGLMGVLMSSGKIIRAVADGPGGYVIKDATVAYHKGDDELELTKTVKLAGSSGMTSHVRLAPEWVGAAGSAGRFFLYTAIGLAVLAFSVVIKRSRIMNALGSTVLAFGLAQAYLGVTVLAVVLILVLLVLAIRMGALRIIIWPFKIILGIPGKVVRACQRRKDTVIPEPLPAEGPMPFEPDDVTDVAEGEEEDSGNNDPRGGKVSVWVLVLMMTLGLFSTAVAARKVTPPGVPVLDSLSIDVEGPGTGRDIEQSANVTEQFTFKTEHEVSFLVIPATCVLKDFDLGSRNLAISARQGGYVLTVKKKGSYKVTLKYQAPVEHGSDGIWGTTVYLLPNMQNKVNLTLPEGGLDIESPEAVLFKAEDAEKETRAEAVFGPAALVHFKWKPRVRKTSLEQAVFSCEVNTYALLRSGVVDLDNMIRYQIAQGEIKDLNVRIPDGMSVTAVQAKGLGTWRYDPEKHMLEAILEKPVSGDLLLHVVTQIGRDGLPYKALLGVPEVIDASRQRGAIAVAASETIQVHVDDKLVNGLHPMNIEDFWRTTGLADQKVKGGKTPSVSTRKAYRYHKADTVTVTVEAERVLPEIRVEENVSVDITDERIKLTSDLSLSIAKSGIFSVELGVPDGFEVETLTGADVSHWDDIDEGPKGGARSVTVHFSRQITDETKLHLVMARMEKGVEENIKVPRITVRDARKHRGSLMITCERGVRLMIDNHRGVDILKNTEYSRLQRSGGLAFDILRPTWSIDLRTEVMKPLVKPEVLQWVDLAEGMLHCTAYINYNIENAGVKVFRLQAPRKGVRLSVTDPNVARISEIDEDKGIWQVDLHNKVEHQSLVVKYQIPYLPESRRADILPLKTLDTEPQRGYLVVTCKGRVQVTPQAAPGLKIENPRNIPREFKAGDLSSAILCYSTVRPDYNLALSVVRHDSANVLPAHVDKVRMASVTSSSGALLTRATLSMSVGNLRLLRVELPNKTDKMWSVRVNEREVSASRDGDVYVIPLEEMESGQMTTVDCVYAGTGSRKLGRQEFSIPKVGYGKKLLPMDDIEWVFYVDPDKEYYGYDGSLRHLEGSGDDTIQPFNAAAYLERAHEQKLKNLELAQKAMTKGRQLIKAGKLQQAQKEFQQAYTWSQGELTLNEDARVQLRNVKVKQAKLGLGNRRNVVRLNANIIDEEQIQQMAEFQKGEFTEAYANSMESALTDKDNDALDLIGNKMIDQESAAGGVVTAIRVVMPEYGKKLVFTRTMATDPSAALNVSFRARSGRVGKWLAEIGIAVLLFVFLWMTSRARHKAA